MRLFGAKVVINKRQPRKPEGNKELAKCKQLIEFVLTLPNPNYELCNMTRFVMLSRTKVADIQSFTEFKHASFLICQGL